MISADEIPDAWRRVLPERAVAGYEAIRAFVEEERRCCTVYPPEGKVFAALQKVRPEEIRAVIVGQDPYHEPGQAQGLSFSVPAGCSLPPSLRNIFKELALDLACSAPETGDLSGWAEQGVLLLNSVLTVRAGSAGSHRGRGWEEFTDGVLEAASRTAPPCVFVLWGADARKKRRLIDGTKHRILEGAHPSPLSAYRGFFGSRPFSKVNAFLRELSRPEIRWTEEKEDTLF